MSDQTVVQDTSYNGWTNYATWGVALVLDNDEESYRTVRALASMGRDSARAYLADPDNAGSVLDDDDVARHEFRDMLKDYVEELCGLEADSDSLSLMARQVLQAGLSEVNWDEIVGNVLDES